MDQDNDAHSLVAKLRVGGPLSSSEAMALEAAITRPTTAAAGTDLIVEGDRPDRVHLVLDGLACRYKVLADGSRQILA